MAQCLAQATLANGVVALANGSTNGTLALARPSDTKAHESVQAPGRAGLLAGRLPHCRYANVETARDRRGSLGKARVHSPWPLLLAYMVRCCSLGGAKGLALACPNAQGSGHRYLKRWRRQRERGGHLASPHG
jgi:hypothetical protein